MLFSFREIKIVCGPDPYLGSLSGQIATSGFTLNGETQWAFALGQGKVLLRPSAISQNGQEYSYMPSSFLVQPSRRCPLRFNALAP
jgi:hypothetical protein